jgi:hypothetical protein
MGIYDNETHETANKNLIVSEQFVEIFKHYKQLLAHGEQTFPF